MTGTSPKLCIAIQAVKKEHQSNRTNSFFIRNPPEFIPIFLAIEHFDNGNLSGNFYTFTSKFVVLWATVAVNCLLTEASRKTVFSVMSRALRVPEASRVPRNNPAMFSVKPHPGEIALFT